MEDFFCEFIPQEEIDEIADGIYNEYWGIDDKPVDVELIAEKMGLQVIPEYITENIDAYLKVDTTGIIINSATFNDERYLNRVRFSFAHELGHYVLHREIIKDLNFSTIDEYFDFIQNLPEQMYKRVEFQANEFAGRLLVPYKKLVETIKRTVKEYRSNNFEELYHKDKVQLLESISPIICIPFGVSDQVIEKRVERENLFTPDIFLSKEIFIGEVK